MSVLIGFLIVFGSVFGGFLMHGGNFLVLVQPSEYLIIGGAALGALVVAHSPSFLARVGGDIADLMKPDPYDEEAYEELLHVLYELFYAARREGLVGIESHVEEPETSEIFQRHAGFLERERAVAFLTDTLKVLMTGAVEEHHLAEILDLDLRRHREDAEKTSDALAKIGDALPGFGIVAAVLGVIITMGHIGGSPEEIGHKIAAALVGTFLGVLGAYGVVNPMAHALEARAEGVGEYLKCIRTAILSFARGDAPLTSVEFARRSIAAEERPTFEELEEMARSGGSSSDDESQIQEAA